ncbi:MAG: SLC13 family permease [Pseudomonadales bacterium]
MSPEAWITVAIIAGTVGTLIATRIAPDLILIGALTLLMVCGALTPMQALEGLSNPALATVAVLYVVAAGLMETGGIHAVGTRLLGRPTSVTSAQLRLMLPVTGLSAFLNNTPVVAMLVPFIEEWARRLRLPVSRLMIPLSYAAILGGLLTAIGTSTNLIVYGLIERTTDLGPMGFFEIGRLGLPVAIVGILFILGTGWWLLPDRRPPLRQPERSREYTLEMLLEAGSPLIGRNLEEAGLRNLPDAYLAEIERGNMVLPAVSRAVRLQAGDRLLFVGVVESMVELLRMRGLVPAPDQLFKLDAPRAERRIFEVVISPSCPIAGGGIRDGRFRTRYDAVVIAAARNGERIRGKIGEIEIRPGDTLLLESRPSFLERQRNSSDFLLVSEVQDASLPRHDRAWLSLAILAAMVASAALGVLSMLEAALIAAGLMLATRCVSVSTARARVDWSVVTAIAASLGLGQALSVSGAAAAIAGWWIALAGDNPWLALIAVYLITSTFTEVITNNAAAVLVFPIAQATAAGLGVSLWPFAAVVMIAASASFATPIGYQTNMMVYGPGGYRFADYLRIGIPLNLLVGAVAVALAPRIWPF